MASTTVQSPAPNAIQGPSPVQRSLPSSVQMLDQLRVLLPDLKVREEDGQTRLLSARALLRRRGAEDQGSLPSMVGPTPEQAIAEAFQFYTAPGSTVYLQPRGAPSYSAAKQQPGFFEARWTGGAWQFLEQRPSPKFTVLPPSTAERVTNRSPPPTLVSVAKYPSLKLGSEAERLLDMGFAADQLPGGDERALAAYGKAGGALRRELASALGDRWLSSAGLSREALLAMDNDAKLHATLGLSGAFAALGKAEQQLVLKYYNRMGLALRHGEDREGALLYVSMALQLDPGYAPAHYNLAAMQLVLGDRAEALASLAEALRLDPEFMKRQALKDPDLNPLRDDPAFWTLVG